MRPHVYWHLYLMGASEDFDLRKDTAASSLTGLSMKSACQGRD